MKKLLMLACLLFSFSTFAEVSTSIVRTFSGYVNPDYYITAFVNYETGQIHYFSRVFTGTQGLDESCLYEIKYSAETLFEIQNTGDCEYDFPADR